MDASEVTLSSAARWLPWALLLNAALMLAVAGRYVTLRDAWIDHRVAVTAYAASLER